MISTSQSALANRWWRANAVAFFIAYVVYTPIAHGVTGSHPGPLSTSQLAAHTIGLVVVSVMVLSAQLWALGRNASDEWRRIGLGSAAFVAAFWLGWYSVGVPADVFVSYTVLATASWISSQHIRGAKFLRSGLVVIGMLAGTALGIAIFVGLAKIGLFVLNTQSSAISHTAVWLCIALGTGCVGGFLSGRVLPRALAP